MFADLDAVAKLKKSLYVFFCCLYPCPLDLFPHPLSSFLFLRSSFFIPLSSPFLPSLAFPLSFPHLPSIRGSDAKKVFFKKPEQQKSELSLVHHGHIRKKRHHVPQIHSAITPFCTAFRCTISCFCWLLTIVKQARLSSTDTPVGQSSKPTKVIEVVPPAIFESWTSLRRTSSRSADTASQGYRILSFSERHSSVTLSLVDVLAPTRGKYECLALVCLTNISLTPTIARSACPCQTIGVSLVDADHRLLDGTDA